MSDGADPARRVALATLDDVLGRPPQRLEQAFAAAADAATLAGRDRAFARLLATATLRRKGQLDTILERYLRYRPDALTTQNLLRLGAAQLLVLDTAPHAAVSATVDLARAERRPEVGLLNAVLRRLARERPELPPAERNLPKWLFERWKRAYGLEQARRIADTQAHEPPLDLTLKTDAAGWAERLGGTRLGPATVRLAHAGVVTELPGYAAGDWWVQDVAASLPVHSLGNVHGLEVLDAAAAPGGKTAQLAAAGASVTSLDIDAGRMALVEANLERLGLQARTITADLETWTTDDRFDVVLLDAPCSATGTIRRHPDVPWHRSVDDIARQAALQARLLDAALAKVRPGGRLLFATCSLEPEEGELLAEAWLHRHAAVHRVAAARPPAEGLNLKACGVGAWRSLPSAIDGGMDGFYVAHFQNGERP